MIKYNPKCVLILTLIILFSSSFSGCLSSNQNIKRQVTVALIITGDNWTIEYLNITTTNDTVFDLLIECSIRKNFTVTHVHYLSFDAEFVTSINGTYNGQDSKYWQYYVNGLYGEIASDKKKINNNDTVEWRFERSKF
jgi:hypothetical protein